MSDTNLSMEILAEQLASLQKQNTELTQRVETQETELQGLQHKNADLTKHLEGFVKGSITIDTKPTLPQLPADPTFTVGKKKYKLLAPSMQIPGIGYRTADEILLDKELQAKLIELKSGLIREVV